MTSLLALAIVACTDEPPPEPPPRAPGPPAVAPLAPLEGEGVRIEVSFPDRAMQRITVRTTRRCPPAGEAEWWMANWTPGSYVIRNHARFVETIRARADEGDAEVVPVAKNRWRVSCSSGAPVTMETTLVATERNVRGNYVAETWATLNPPAAFLLPEPPTGPFDVSVVLPLVWPDVVAPLPRVADDPPTFRAEDLDTLIDSPIAVGQLTQSTLTVGGVPHHFVTFGDERTFDRDVLDHAVADLIATQQAFWGQIPYDEYWFLQALTPTYGGLEHARSTLMMATPAATETPENKVRWLGLVSHELFHTWNVQRLRPRSLLAQDYETETHTKLLWVSEGWTSYYDDLLLARAGLVDEAEYLELLGRQIRRVSSRPGRLVQSLAQSSFDAWTKHYAPTPHQHNSTVSYYTKGAVVAFLLDATIRRSTQGRASLDDVARELLALSQAAPTEPLDERLRSMGDRRHVRGITPADVREVASRIAGRDLGAFFDDAVDGAAELDFGGALQWFGLALEPEETRPVLGVTLTDRAGRVTVEGVSRGSPAWRAGLNVGDELLAVDGRRAEADLTTLIAGCVARRCELLRSRDGRVASIHVQAELQPGPVSLVVDEGASPIAKRRRRTWLGQ